MIKVFLIEDEIVIREALERMIPWKEYGFELVGKAKDGEIALPMIRKSKPDVLITDIKMPFMDGLTLSSIVKKEFPNIRIVIVSGYEPFLRLSQSPLLQLALANNHLHRLQSLYVRIQNHHIH